MCRRVESERIVPVCLPGSEKKNTWTVVAGFGRSERDKNAESDGRLRQVAPCCPFNRRQALAAQRGTSTQSQMAESGKYPQSVPLTGTGKCVQSVPLIGSGK